MTRTHAKLEKLLDKTGTTHHALEWIKWGLLLGHEKAVDELLKSYEGQEKIHAGLSHYITTMKSLLLNVPHLQAVEHSDLRTHYRQAMDAYSLEDDLQQRLWVLQMTLYNLMRSEDMASSAQRLLTTLGTVMREFYNKTLLQHCEQKYESKTQKLCK